MSQTPPSAAGPLTWLVASQVTWRGVRTSMLPSRMVQTCIAETSKQRKGMHDEKKPTLARDETPGSGSIPL
ncbi:hypothetical protein KSF_063640 [Reticulibacter mediterranei]|uniref:Uncharacterized protein n=1 Tax=Reticulibacter mediterranei TaxID=2778369 RepID=A0A8J3IU96_9CHLR|nr:hypothetical protein [Reticulibacter mediterranei]GHO96316.1 hypothetical protein KSF_063640 [Reticulibacter mediterranei]